MSQLIDSSLAAQFDKLPPHSLEAEMCLLASMMLDKEMVGQVVQIVDREASTRPIIKLFTMCWFGFTSRIGRSTNHRP